MFACTLSIKVDIINNLGSAALWQQHIGIKDLIPSFDTKYLEF